MVRSVQSSVASRPRSLIFAGLVVLCLTLIVAAAAPDRAFLHSVVGLMFVVCFGPAWLDWHRGRLDFFETIHVIGLIYFVFFGLGSIWVAGDPSLAYDHHLVKYVPRAALYCLIGYVFFLAGYYGPWWRAYPRREWEEVPTSGLAFLGIPAVAGGLGALASAERHIVALQHLPISTPLNALSQMVPLFLFAWALGWILVLSGRATVGHRAMLFGMLIPAAVMIIVLRPDDKSLAVTLVGVPLISLWYGRGHLPWKTLVALVLLVAFVVFPLANTFRSFDPTLPFEKRVTLTADRIRSWSLEQYQRVSLHTFKGRLAMVNSVAVVVRDVPRWVPYENGEHLLLAPAMIFVPRFMWPDKPKVTIGREFGVTFRVVHVLDESTNIGATVPGELYWNFGLGGIIAGMLIWGLAARWLFLHYGVAAALDPVGKAVHIVLLIQFAHLGGGLVAGIGGFVKILAVLAIFRWMMRRWGLLERRWGDAPKKGIPGGKIAGVVAN